MNVIRAERCAGLAVETRRVAADVPIMRGERAVPVTVESLRRRAEAGAAEARDARAPGERVPVPARCGRGGMPVINGPSSRQGRIVEAQVPLSQLASIASHEDVAYLEMAEALKTPGAVVADRRPRRRPRASAASTAPRSITTARACSSASSTCRGSTSRIRIFSTSADGRGSSASGIRAAPAAPQPGRHAVRATDPRSPTAT